MGVLKFPTLPSSVRGYRAGASGSSLVTSEGTLGHQVSHEHGLGSFHLCSTSDNRRPAVHELDHTNVFWPAVFGDDPTSRHFSLKMRCRSCRFKERCPSIPWSPAMKSFTAESNPNRLQRFAPQRLAHRTRKRSPDLSLALTPPSPRGRGGIYANEASEILINIIHSYKSHHIGNGSTQTSSPLS
jgi:hypothetical protein